MAAAADALVICPWFVVNGEVVRTMVMAARFDSTDDVTLGELAVELVYPLDAQAKAFFRA